MDIQSLTDQIAQRRTDLGQRIAQLPQQQSQYAEQLYGGDRQLGSLRDNENAKIQELYQHDKMLADQYANQSSPLYMADPYAREKARAIQTQGTVAELGDIQKNVAKRKDVIGGALDNALKMLQAGIEAEKLQMDSLNQERQFQFELGKAKGTIGGSGNGNLNDLFNAITGFQNQQQEYAPAASGKVKDRAALSLIQKSHPGETVHFTKNKDGSYAWSVFKPNQKIASPEYADKLQAGDNTIRQLVAAAVANNPKQSSDIQALYKLLSPQSSNTFGYSQGEVGAGVAGQPRTPETLSAYQQYVQSKGGGISSLLQGGGTDLGTPDTGSTGGTMRVRVIQTGQTGTIPASEFDSSVYEAL